MSVNQSRMNWTSCSRTSASTSSFDVLAPEIVSVAATYLAPSIDLAVAETRRRARPPAVLFSNSGRNLVRLMGLQDLLAGLAGADADRILDREHEDLPVADRARSRVRQNRLCDDADVFVV